MLTIQQMVRAVRNLQTRVDALEAAAKPVIAVEKPVVAAETPVRRGRPPRVVEPEPVIPVEPNKTSTEV
jgi:hypothetical protein